MELVCFIILIMFPFTAVYADYQVDALIAFKKALDDRTGVLSTWILNSSHPCSWKYIYCQFASNVTTIDLGNKSLPGSLVPELGNLSTLQFLLVSSNELNGSIPAELGNLTNLLDLDLFNNSLTGSIPQELSKLNNLNWLSLNDNNLSGVVPFPDPVTSIFPYLKNPANFSNNPNLCGNLTNPHTDCPPT